MQCMCKPTTAGALHYSVWVYVDVNGKLCPNHRMQTGPLYLLWLFSEPEALDPRDAWVWPYFCGSQWWIKTIWLLWEPASKDFTLPSNPCIPGLGFYQIVFVIPLDFSNKQWNASIWPEGKPPSYWRGKEYNTWMTHGFAGEVMAVCHSLGCEFVIWCHVEWMCLGCEVNVNDFGGNCPVNS